MIRGRGRRWLRAVLAATGLQLAAWGCAGSPRVPDVPRPAPQAFERGPYLQAVTDSSAVVRWAGRDPDATGSLRYLVGGDWQPAAAEHLPGGGRSVRLTGLPPDATVRYEVTEAGRTLGPYRFRTAPRGRGEGPVRVLVFGDSGWGSEEQVFLAERMAGRDWDVTLHVGDIAYPEGSREAFTLRHFHVYSRLLARVPFFPVPGNHDLRTAGGRPYDRAFEAPGDAGRRYYRFRWGSVLFVGLDTSTPGAASALEEGRGRQFRWLRRSLQSASRDTSVRWTIVYMHHPLYSSAGGLSGHGPSRGLQKSLRPLLETEGVDLVLAGHDHHYERFRPLLEGRPVPAGCGPVYLVTGGGGASRHARTVEGGRRTAARSRRHHFLSLAVGRRRISGRAVGLAGTAIDSFRVRPYEAGARPARCGD